MTRRVQNVVILLLLSIFIVLIANNAHHQLQNSFLEYYRFFHTKDFAEELSHRDISELYTLAKTSTEYQGYLKINQERQFTIHPFNCEFEEDSIHLVTFGYPKSEQCQHGDYLIKTAVFDNSWSPLSGGATGEYIHVRKINKVWTILEVFKWSWIS